MLPTPLDLWVAFYPDASTEFSANATRLVLKYVDTYDADSLSHFPIADNVAASIIGGGPLDQDLFASTPS